VVWLAVETWGVEGGAVGFRKRGAFVEIGRRGAGGDERAGREEERESWSSS
jgi:hypothetical protein